MAIIVDPDNLDRNQVIFGTSALQISLFPVGAEVNADAAASSNGNNGITAAGTSNTFTSAGSTFQTDLISAGDILVIKSNNDAGHYPINAVLSETLLDVVETPAAVFKQFTGTEAANFEIRSNALVSSTGISDGVTLQALYSFAKEEWKADSANVAGDDLIRHEFPFEAITSEQFETGGGAAHADWRFFTPFTRKKVRTGGWAQKLANSTTANEYTGVVTLGSIDSDAQVYYQPNNTAAVPVNFDFLGAVNEPIQVFEAFTGDAADDTRTFLKLFVRKKARSYAGSQISDIGVTTIQTIVNRFPLAHSTDAAIVASDAKILGSTPFRNQANTISSTAGEGGAADGVTSGSTFTITTGNVFNTFGNTVTGDVLEINTGQTDEGFYSITGIDTAGKVLTLDTSENTLTGASTLAYGVHTTTIFADKETTPGTQVNWGDATLTNNLTAVDGNIVSATADSWAAQAVAVGDMAILSNQVTGVYKVTAVNTQNLTVDTSDLETDFAGETNVSFRIVEPGMYLQFKNISVTNNNDDYTFHPANNAIRRDAGTWDASIAAGTMLSVTNANVTANNGRYTVLARDDGTQVRLISTDTLTSDGAASGDIVVFEGFKRLIGGSTFAFRWRVFANSGTLANLFQFIQHQLRQTSDIDFGTGTSRGDVTDLLMSFATPTGTSLDLAIDDIAAGDVNNMTLQDHSGVNRAFPFTAAGNLNFNTNLTGDTAAIYRLFFTNDDAGDNTGRDYGTKDAITVNDFDGVAIEGNVSVDADGNGDVAFTYDYDNNVQRGAASAATDAPVTLVAIGLSTAQFVITTGTITRISTIVISAVAALERNYSNP